MRSRRRLLGTIVLLKFSDRKNSECSFKKRIEGIGSDAQRIRSDSNITHVFDLPSRFSPFSGRSQLRFAGMCNAGIGMKEEQDVLS